MKFFLILIPIIFMGCSTAKGFKLPDLNLFKHEQTGDVQAIKTGDVVPIKGPIKAEARAEGTATGQIGGTNTQERLQAARDIRKSEKTTTINSDTVMVAIISAMSAAMGSLGSIVLALLVYVRILSRQRAEVEKRLLDFMSKQEDGQNKYIQLLESITKTVLSGIEKRQEEKP